MPTPLEAEETPPAKRPRGAEGGRGGAAAPGGTAEPHFARVAELVRAGRVRLLVVVSPARTGSTMLEHVLGASPSVAAHVSQPFDLPLPRGAGPAPAMRTADRTEAAFAVLRRAADAAAAPAGAAAPATVVVKEMCRNVADPASFDRLAAVTSQWVFLVRNPLLCLASSLRGVVKWAVHNQRWVEADAGITLDGLAADAGCPGGWGEVARRGQIPSGLVGLRHIAASLDMNVHPSQEWAGALRAELRAAAPGAATPPLKLSPAGWMGAALVWRRLRGLGAARVYAADGTALRAMPAPSLRRLCAWAGVEYADAMVERFGTGPAGGEAGGAHLSDALKSTWMNVTDGHIRPPTDRPPAVAELPPDARAHFADTAARVWVAALRSPLLALPAAAPELLATPVADGTPLRDVDPVFAYAADADAARRAALRERHAAHAAAFDAIDAAAEGAGMWDL